MSDETEAPAEEGAGEEAPKKPGTVMALGVLGGGLVLGAVAGLLLVGPMVARAAGVGHVANDSASAEAGGEKEHKAEGEGGAKSPMHEIDNLVLNPAGSGGTRFLIASVAIELNDEALGEVLTARDAEVRDAILRVLGTKTVEELSDVSVRESIKKEMQTTLDTLFKKKDAVRRLYFPQFVIQ
jgi:flagellar FliL protein